MRDDSDSIIKPSGEDISPSSSAGSSPIKEQPEDDKDSDASVTPMRKSGAEPNFPSVVKRKRIGIVLRGYILSNEWLKKGFCILCRCRELFSSAVVPALFWCLSFSSGLVVSYRIHLEKFVSSGFVLGNGVMLI